MNPVDWTIGTLRAKITEAQTRAVTEWKTLGENSARVVALYSKADAIPDLAARATIKRGLEAWAARQARLQADFNAAYSKWATAYNAAAKFLHGVGIDLPATPGSLGVLPAAVLVPAAIAGLVLVALAWLAAIHDRNVTQRHGLDSQSGLLAARLAGKITEREYLEGSRAAAATADQQDGGAGIFQGAAGLVLPALALVALIMLGPRLIPQRRSA